MLLRTAKALGDPPAPAARALSVPIVSARQITPLAPPAAVNLAISIPTRQVPLVVPNSPLRATQEPQNMPFHAPRSTLPAGLPVAPPAPTAIANSTAVVAEVASPKEKEAAPPAANAGIPQQKWAAPHEDLSPGGAEDSTPNDSSAPEKPASSGGGAGLGLAALAALFFFR